MSGQVVVGVDGSQSGRAAVEAAAQEADRSGVELRLAHAFAWPSAHVPRGVPPWDQGGAGAGRVAKGALTEAEGWAHRAAPQVRVTHEVLVGSPVAVLESQCREASLVVVGSRLPGRSGALRPDSVAGQLAAHGRTPVLVVRGRPDPTGPVVLAGGHAQEVPAAAEFAYAEASARGANLVVLDRTTAWNSRSRTGFSDTLSLLSEKYPDVTMHRVRVRARVRGGLCRALVEVSTRAQLVVVGSRDRGRLAGALLSPVGRAALRHADCPVAVIRAEEE
ncbi:universal stress protein [Streptomyces pseudovenezuelae]|uniref:Nucleotide-binding universal stress UspA family protein n=1 Tax=Streptomyces pseudovenezuelae TaxID=67350 RepID=A0ABT6LNR8_9ACTN|nr:universal stress protein [Streptomyces pseudovenezuelae]MDH6217957.1 nucleotide-binding universal stress UspA family protein [Streptomyces pseudovenezuelae]